MICCIDFCSPMVVGSLVATNEFLPSGMPLWFERSCMKRERRADRWVHVDSKSIVLEIDDEDVRVMTSTGEIGWTWWHCVEPVP